MSFKKCLKTSRGWSFIEYALIFVAVIAGVVVFLNQTLSGSGRIHNAFRAKTDNYIATITTNAPIIEDPGSGSCDRVALQQQIDALDEQIAALQEQIPMINQESAALEQTKNLFRPACNYCHHSCETNCSQSCNSSCEASCTNSFDPVCFPNCVPACISECRPPCDENCDNNNNACVRLRGIESLQAELQRQIDTVNQQIQDSQQQKAALQAQLNACA